MRTAIRWALLAACALVPIVARAQCNGGNCTLTITMQTTTGGITLGGSGSNAVTMAFGSMQAFGGSTPTGVTKTVTASSWTINAFFDIKVTCTVVIGLFACGNGNSPSYALTGKLQTADATNTWKLGGQVITSGGTATIATANTYSTAYTYTVAITIPFTEAAGTISNTINLVATSN